MNAPPYERTWQRKFANAFRGIGLAIKGQSSFHVHLAMTGAVIASAALLHATRIEWCLLILCISTVVAAEAFNSAIESMAKALHPAHNPQLGNALDIASGAVLLVSIGASTIGVLILGYRFALAMHWM